MENVISYSKISVVEQCGYKYKLVYVDKHFINQPSIATDFGTLVHYIEENIGNKIKNKESIDYDYFKNLFLVGDNEVKGIYELKDLYPNEYITPDKNNRTYEDKVNYYLSIGIYRLQNYLTENPNIEIIGTEIPFDYYYKDYKFHGFIDRVFYNHLTKSYIVEDVKTYSAPLEHKDLVTPLQFVIYVKALKNLYSDSNEDTVECYYDLPLCNEKQKAGTKGYLKRGLQKIDKLLNKIEEKDYKPNPSPLCHWCCFCPTSDNQPEEAKGLCPYYSHWTKENKDMSVENEWMGEDNHEAILEAFRNGKKKTIIKPISISKKQEEFNIEIENIFNKRRFLINFR